MPVVRHFIRHSSVKGLQAYFKNKDFSLSGVDWTQDHATVSRQVIQMLDHLPELEQVRVRADFERIKLMSDELGQAALFSVIADLSALASMETALERSHWVYVHKPECFRHAEDIRYAAQYRHGRNWSG